MNSSAKSVYLASAMPRPQQTSPRSKRPEVGGLLHDPVVPVEGAGGLEGVGGGGVAGTCERLREF